MSASPEQLDELLMYCVDFAKKMLSDFGEFYPFGAVLNTSGQVVTVAGDNGEEKPKSQDIYRLLSDSFASNASEGSVVATALASNVNIPVQFSAPAPDGIRVHLESADLSRYIYAPYSLKKRHGLFKKAWVVELFEFMSVQIAPVFFKRAH